MESGLTEVGLPKTLTCDSEGSCLGIKDICVDEGINTVHKASVVTMVEDVKLHSSPHLVNEYFTNEIHTSGSVQPKIARKRSSETAEYSSGSSAEEFKDTTDTFHGNPCDEANVKRIDGKLCPPPESEIHQLLGHIGADSKNVKPVSLAHLLQEDRENRGFVFEQASETEGLIPLEEFDRRYCSLHSSNFDVHNDPSHLVNNGPSQHRSENNGGVRPPSMETESHQLPRVRGAHVTPVSDELPSLHTNINWEKADEGALIESNSSTSAVNYEELKGGNEAEAFTANKSGGDIISYDMGIKGTPELEQFSMHATGTTISGKSSDGSASLAWTGFNHQSHSDPNILGSASFSHQILYLGQAPYSGNISLRSDSSTTSTRSFAFPVLQSEWNNSPVRMARVERRRLRRGRWWGSGLLCCKF